MDFHLPKEIETFRAAVLDFVENEVEPVAQQIEDNDEIPARIVEMAREMGLFGLSIPEEYGGLGVGMVGKCAIYEELGKTHNGFTTLIGAHTGIGTVGLVEMGNEEQKQRFLPKMATGEWIGAFALTEPEAGSNATNLRTTAVRQGDRYILNGSKHYITNALEAQVVTVMAVTDPSKGAKGITSFLVEKGTPGFTIGKTEKKMGLRGSHSCELFFENVEVSIENRLGEEGQGYVNALKILTNGRAGLAARNLGSSQYLLDRSLQYANERVQFGKPIAEQQAVAHMLADMATDLRVEGEMRKRSICFFAIICSFMFLLTACGSATSQPVQKQTPNTPQQYQSDDVTVKVNSIDNGERFKAFYQNYSQGKQDHVRVIVYTDEGDPIYTSVEMQGDQLHVSYDNSQDKFGGSKKGEQTFTCSSIAASKEGKGTTYLLLGCQGHDDTINDSMYLLRLP